MTENPYQKAIDMWRDGYGSGNGEYGGGRLAPRALTPKVPACWMACWIAPAGVSSQKNWGEHSEN